jgi:hypothetical protein
MNQSVLFRGTFGILKTFGICGHQVASIVIGATPTPKTNGIVVATAAIAREFGRIPEI